MAKSVRFASKLGYVGNSNAINGIPFGAVINPFGLLSENDFGLIQREEISEESVVNLRCTSCGAFETTLTRSSKMACEICGVTNVIPTDHMKYPQLNGECIEIVSGDSMDVISSLVFVIDTHLQPHQLHDIHDSIKRAVLAVGKHNINLSLIVISRVVTVYRCCIDGVVSGDVFGSVESLKRLPDHQVAAYLSSATACFDTFLTTLLSIKGARTPCARNQSSNPRRRKIMELMPRNLALAIQISLHLFHKSNTNASSTRVIVCLDGYPNVDASGVSQPPLSLSATALSPEDASRMRSAHQLFHSIAQEAVASGVGIDIFCSGLQTVNAPMLYDLVDPTGGIVLLQQSFSVLEFGNNLTKMLSEQVMLKSAESVCELEVISSGAIKVAHLGPASCFNSDYTHTFKLRRFDPRVSLSIYLESPPSDTSDLILQVIAHTNVRGRHFRRITSLKIAKTTDETLFLSSIDEEVVAVLLAKAAAQNANDYSVGSDMESLRLSSCERLDSWLSDFVKYHMKGSKDIQHALPASMSGSFLRSLYFLRFGQLLGDTHSVTLHTLYMRVCCFTSEKCQCSILSIIIIIIIIIIVIIIIIIIVIYYCHLLLLLLSFIIIRCTMTCFACVGFSCEWMSTPRYHSCHPISCPPKLFKATTTNFTQSPTIP
jgi:hypothetical protein